MPALAPHTAVDELARAGQVALKTADGMVYSVWQTHMMLKERVSVLLAMHVGCC